MKIIINMFNVMNVIQRYVKLVDVAKIPNVKVVVAPM
jgi:hypothetical protein